MERTGKDSMTDYVKKLLDEALPLSLAKEYMKVEWDKERYKEWFGDKYRIEIPIESEIKIPPEIKKAVEDAGYDIVDYRLGHARRKGITSKNVTSISKILQTVDPELKLKFDKDTARASKDTEIENYTIIISRHPYDIAGMSTGRDWARGSCMTQSQYEVMSREVKKALKQDIKYGTLVAYLVDKDDLNIKDPVGRIAIKPLYHEFSNKIYLYPERPYGLPLKQFTTSVQKWLDKNQKDHPAGTYRVPEDVYTTSAPNTFEVERTHQREYLTANLKYFYLQIGDNDYQDSAIDGLITFLESEPDTVATKALQIFLRRFLGGGNEFEGIGLYVIIEHDAHCKVIIQYGTLKNGRYENQSSRHVAVTLRDVNIIMEKGWCKNFDIIDCNIKNPNENELYNQPKIIDCTLSGCVIEAGDYEFCTIINGSEIKKGMFQPTSEVHDSKFYGGQFYGRWYSGEWLSPQHGYNDYGTVMAKETESKFATIPLSFINCGEPVLPLDEVQKKFAVLPTEDGESLERVIKKNGSGSKYSFLLLKQSEFEKAELYVEDISLSPTLKASAYGPEWYNGVWKNGVFGRNKTGFYYLSKKQLNYPAYLFYIFRSYVKNQEFLNYLNKFEENDFSVLKKESEYSWTYQVPSSTFESLTRNDINYLALRYYVDYVSQRNTPIWAGGTFKNGVFSHSLWVDGKWEGGTWDTSAYFRYDDGFLVMNITDEAPTIQESLHIKDTIKRLLWK